MRDFLKQLYADLTRRLGVRPRLEPIEKIRPVDVRQSTNHWSSFLYNVQFQPVVIEGESRRGVDVGGVSFQQNGKHPYVQILLRGQNSDDTNGAMHQLLQDYYRFIRTEDIAQPGLIPHLDAPVPEEGSGAECIFPWSTFGASARQRSIGAGEKTGDDFLQKVSKKRLARQIDGFQAVTKQIQEMGKKSSPQAATPVDAVVLFDTEHNWRWMPAKSRDNRRLVAAYGACGWERFPLRVHRLVFREHAERWPGVVAGEYTPGEAVAFFDRLFHRRTSPIIKSWPATDR